MAWRASVTSTSASTCITCLRRDSSSQSIICRWSPGNGMTRFSVSCCFIVTALNTTVRYLYFHPMAVTPHIPSVADPIFLLLSRILACIDQCLSIGCCAEGKALFPESVEYGPHLADQTSPFGENDERQGGKLPR